MITFAVDPSTRSTGIAIFDEDVLIEVHCMRIPYSKGKDAIAYMTSKVASMFKVNVAYYPKVELVMEDQVWRNAQEKMKPMSFATLYGLVCSIYTECYFINKEKKIHLYLPRTWKGTVPKKKMCERIKKNEPNKELLKDANDDIIDAVGIGRFHLRKTKK